MSGGRVVEFRLAFERRCWRLMPEVSITFIGHRWRLRELSQQTGSWSSVVQVHCHDWPALFQQ